MPLRPDADCDVLIDAFTARYTSPKTRTDRARQIRELLAGRQPAELTEAVVLSWCRGEPRILANNTIRNRVGLARTFLRWTDRRHVGPDLDIEEELAVVRRSYPATYGKVQDKHDARRLSRQEVDALFAACSDGTWQGSRDQLAIRFGIMGLRVAEICALTWGDLHTDGSLTWTGKGRKARVVRLGPTMIDQLARWRRAYEKGMARPLVDSDVIVCRMNTANQHSTGRSPAWGRNVQPDAYRVILSHRATVAGLGHVAPHDLRRTTAALLHSSRSDDGAHRFSTEDIRIVLGHARLDTTQRYLDPLDTDAIERAAAALD